MHVEVVAYTSLWDVERMEETMKLDRSAKAMESVIEFAGRSCYESFHKPRVSTRRNDAYISNIIDMGHESVLEHASVSFYVTGVSRNMLLELERHRHLSFSVVSTRFVDMSNAMVVIPPALRDDDGVVLEPLGSTQSEYYEELVMVLQGDGLTRKEAREAARYRLPGNLETKFVVTGNLRAWRDVLKKRFSTHADAEIRLFAEQVLRLLRTEVAPNVFADFPLTPFD